MIEIWGALVMLMVVGGEEGGKGFVLTPEDAYMLSNDLLTFIVCSSGSFNSKLVAANGSEYENE